MKRILAFLLLGVVLVASGCGGDEPGPAATQSNTLIEGQIGTADFEMNVGAANSSGHHVDGPFVLRGTNLAYVDSLSALVVDLSVRNNGRRAQPEPVTLTFVDLIPPSVTVQNADNGMTGDGAAITFAFANDDGVWTPGEESLARRVQFGVGKGVAIGFVGQLNVGQAANGGTIAGTVWLDSNEDGVHGEDEPGIPGVPIRLSSFSSNTVVAAGDDDDDHDGGDNDGNSGSRRALTDADGHFAFEGVPAGAYVVSKVPTMSSGRPTTPAQIYVLLTETDGEVADFLDANFGCIR